MGLFPERQREIPRVQERPDEASPLNIEKKEVVTPVPAQFKKQVISDTGQPLIQSPATKVVTIQLPADSVQLTSLAKGSVGDAITWLAAFWLRMIKKALHFGWRILGINNNANT